MLSSVAKAFQEVVPLKLLRSKLLQQSGFYLVGQTLQKAVSFLLLPVWTIYLTPSDYGIMGTLAAYSSVLSILLMFGIYGAVTRHYFDFKNDHETQRRYVSSVFLFLAVVSGTILTLLILFGRPLWEHMTSDKIPFRPLVVLMLITVYGGLLYRLPYTLYQAQQKVKKCVTLDLVGFVLSIGICLLLVVGLRKGIYGMILGGCIAQILTALIVSGLLVREWFVPKVEWRHISSTLVFGLPIVPHLISAWALSFVDRVMLAKMVPLDEVGRYTLGYTLGMVMLMIVTSINDAYQPYYYNLMTSSPNPQPKILRIISFYLAGLGFVALIGSIFAGELIALLTPVKYHGSALYVPPIIIGYFMVGLYFFVSSPIFYYKKTHVLPIITGISAVLNIILNYLLIPKFGAIAAAWNTLVCYAVMLVIYYIVAQKQSVFPYPIWRTMLVLVFLLMAIFISGSVAVFTPAAWMIKSGMVGVYSIFAYLLFIKPFRTMETVTPSDPI
jgi:O-antigen/teichoic acid export membrane protein